MLWFRQLVAGLLPKAWVRSQAMPRHICGGQSVSKTGFPMSHLVFVYECQWQIFHTHSSIYRQCCI